MNLEWGDKENRIAVIASHKCGVNSSTILKTLSLLKISRVLIHQITKRYIETGGVSINSKVRTSEVSCNETAGKTLRERIR